MYLLQDADPRKRVSGCVPPVGLDTRWVATFDIRTDYWMPNLYGGIVLLLAWLATLRTGDSETSQRVDEIDEVDVPLLGQARDDSDVSVGHADPVLLAAAVHRRHDQSVGCRFDRSLPRRRGTAGQVLQVLHPGAEHAEGPGGVHPRMVARFGAAAAVAAPSCPQLALLPVLGGVLPQQPGRLPPRTEHGGVGGRVAYLFTDRELCRS